MIRGLDEITTLIARYTEVEVIYLQREDTMLEEKFETCLISMYAKVLEFQVRANCYFKRNTFGRLVLWSFLCDAKSTDLTSSALCESHS